MAELLFHLKPEQGYNNVFELGDKGMKLTRFGILQLKAGTSYTGNTGEFEVALVVLGGKCRVSGDEFNFVDVGERKSVFDGKPFTVYLPRRTAYAVTATTDVDLAVNESPASRDTARPTVITPDMTRTISIGRDNFTRSATIMLDETFDSEHFYIGEGMIPSGNWSGYPPHRHDVDDLPREVDMEETYVYRFDPARALASRRSMCPMAALTRPTPSSTTTPSPLPRAIIRCVVRLAIRCTICGPCAARSTAV